MENTIECKVNLPDTIWVGISSTLIMLMPPSMGFVYAGLINQGSMSSMLGLCFAIFALVTIIWSTVGYSLVFGNSLGGIIGDMRYVGLTNLDSFQNKCLNQFTQTECYEKKYYFDSCGIPEILFFLFQNRFAAITTVLILGSISERMYLKYCLLFIILWTLFVFCPVSHWVWNVKGFLYQLGTRDFAGGLVVHVSSGFSALICSFILGKRKSFGSSPEVVNFPYVILGTMLLWFGWFGFNGGSSFKINSIAINSLVNTNISASTSLIIWILMDLLIVKKISAVGIAMGTICGLVAITPGAGYVPCQYAFVFGAVAGFLAWSVIMTRKKLMLYDDLDVFACHGISGCWGTIATGLFASKKINQSLNLDGLAFSGENKMFILYQLIAILIVPLYSSLITFIIMFSMKKWLKIRTKSHEEIYNDQINFFDDFNQEKNLKKLEVIR